METGATKRRILDRAYQLGGQYGLEALHHLNPYTHVIRQELFDPVYGFSSWHNLRSPYEPLFISP